MAAFLSQLYQPDLTTMTMLALILPVLAIGTILWFTTRHLPLVLGTFRLEQSCEDNPQRVREMAHQRDQGDEYETLVAMEFQPLGIYNETVKCLGEGIPQLIFAHRSLPVFASLAQNIDQQRFVIMMTEGQGKKYLRTSSASISPKACLPDLRLIVAEADYTEDVLKDHMQAVSEWSEEGFVPVSGNGLADYSRQCREYTAHSYITNLLRGSGIIMTLASLVTLTLTPVVLGASMTWLYASLFKLDFIPFIPLSQFVSGAALAFGGHLYWKTKWIPANEESNSLKKSPVLSATKPASIDSGKSVNGRIGSY